MADVRPLCHYHVQTAELGMTDELVPDHPGNQSLYETAAEPLATNFLP